MVPRRGPKPSAGRLASGRLMERVAGAILAGGQARRFGADKVLAPLADRPLLAHAAERLAPQCGCLILNANGDASRFAGFEFPVVADDPPDSAGPLAGILAVLDHIAEHRPEVGLVASVAADTPFIPRDFVPRLVAGRAGADAEIAVAASAGRRHHVCALWPVGLRHALRAALIGRGERSVGRFLAGRNTVEVVWAAEPVDPFLNINTPADLAEAARLITP